MKALHQHPATSTNWTSYNDGQFATLQLYMQKHTTPFCCCFHGEEKGLSLCTPCIPFFLHFASVKPVGTLVLCILTIKLMLHEQNLALYFISVDWSHQLVCIHTFRLDTTEYVCIPVCSLIVSFGIVLNILVPASGRWVYAQLEETRCLLQNWFHIQGIHPQYVVSICGPGWSAMRIFLYIHTNT